MSGVGFLGIVFRLGVCAALWAIMLTSIGNHEGPLDGGDVGLIVVCSLLVAPLTIITLCGTIGWVHDTCEDGCCRQSA